MIPLYTNTYLYPPARRSNPLLNFPLLFFTFVIHLSASIFLLFYSFLFTPWSFSCFLCGTNSFSQQILTHDLFFPLKSGYYKSVVLAEGERINEQAPSIDWIVAHFSSLRRMGYVRLTYWVNPHVEGEIEKTPCNLRFFPFLPISLPFFFFSKGVFH